VSLRSDGTGVVLAFEGGNRKELAQLSGPWQGVARGNQTVAGDPRVRLRVGDLTLGFGPRTFYQVNLPVNEVLVRRVTQEITALAPEAVLELYSGAGNLTLPIAATGVSITALESHPEAVDDARKNAKELGLPVRFTKANADRVQLGEHPFDVLLLDPPRAGAPGVLKELLAARPRGIVYVSCNAGALARDLRGARSDGYRIHRLEVLDMFPQTPHAEVLCVLYRP
jgi:23S rRNA (uracil1939-C5)-methyltransferase